MVDQACRDQVLGALNLWLYNQGQKLYPQLRAGDHLQRHRAEIQRPTCFMSGTAASICCAKASWSASRDHRVHFGDKSDYLAVRWASMRAWTSTITPVPCKPATALF